MAKNENIVHFVITSIGHFEQSEESKERLPRRYTPRNDTGATAPVILRRSRKNLKKTQSIVKG